VRRARERGQARVGAVTDDRHEQEARNGVRFRDRNEWIQRANERSATDGSAPVAYVCECGDVTCETPITLTIAEYEAVRASATRFAIAPNHENPESEFVVDEHALYTVVEKIAANVRRIIRDTDPRRVSWGNDDQL
jgi:hypothetical protein